MLFKPAGGQTAYLKLGLMGFAGSGKTYTATEIATGLIHHMRKRDIQQGALPAFFLDTETGSDWVIPRFAANDIQLHVAKTRAFKDLCPAVREAEANGSVLIIDSISHFWTELMESYAKRKNRTRGLEFQDWAWLKQKWREFTDLFVNSKCHIIMAGRAGYEYDFFTSDSGKRELEKTGIKMKAETETGYEPSLLLLMERHTDMDSMKTYRTATVLKDRSDILDGKVFRNPTFESILPHVEFLNLGGEHLGVDLTRTTEGDIPRTERSEWAREKERKEIVLDEIQQLMVKHYPSTSKEDRVTKIELMETHFGTRSWKKIEVDYTLEECRRGFDSLHLALEGKPAYPPREPEVTPEELDAQQDAALP